MGFEILSDTRLATFIHISDTHLGDLDSRTGDASLGEDVRERWLKDRHFYGFLGHSCVALRQFAALFTRLRETEGAQLVHSGDLTRWGGASQFSLAKKYFRARIETPSGPVGLDDPAALDLAIPGNHDHWPGNGWVLGRSGPALRRFFRPLPLAPRRVPLTGGRSILFAGIDTDADVWPWSPSRALARGAFLSQIRSLARALPSRRPDEIRVLLLHHSPAFRGVNLGIQRRSRVALDRLVARHGFRVLLTGHIHTPAARVRGDILEARCGTTLLRDHLPADWLASGGGPVKPLPQNSLLVHRLFEIPGGSLEWRATLHLRTEAGFVDGGALPGAAAFPISVSP